VSNVAILIQDEIGAIVYLVGLLRGIVIKFRNGACWLFTPSTHCTFREGDLSSRSLVDSTVYRGEDPEICGYAGDSGDDDVYVLM
jgi:hypothetical protein